MFSTCVNALHSTMNNKEPFTNNKSDFSYAVATLIVLVLWLVIILLVGQLLWNNIFIELFPFVKKITSIWKLLGLVILLSLIVPR